MENFRRFFQQVYVILHGFTTCSNSIIYIYITLHHFTAVCMMNFITWKTTHHYEWCHFHFLAKHRVFSQSDISWRKASDYGLENYHQHVHEFMIQASLGAAAATACESWWDYWERSVVWTCLLLTDVCHELDLTELPIALSCDMLLREGIVQIIQLRGMRQGWSTTRWESAHWCSYLFWSLMCLWVILVKLFGSQKSSRICAQEFGSHECWDQWN